MCKHLKGSLSKREQHITNIKNIANNVPRHMNLFKVNAKFALFPIGTSNRDIAVVDLSISGQSNHFYIECANNIQDFCLDPFDDHRVVVGQRSGTVDIFQIPPTLANGCLTTFQTRLNTQLVIDFVQLNPLVKDVLSIGGSQTILVVNIENQQSLATFKFDSTILDIAWNTSQLGASLIAVALKKNDLVIVDVLKSFHQHTEHIKNKGPIEPTSLPKNVSNLKLCWTCDDTLLIVVGFDK